MGTATKVLEINTQDVEKSTNNTTADELPTSNRPPEVTTATLAEKDELFRSERSPKNPFKALEALDLSHVSSSYNDCLRQLLL